MTQFFQFILSHVCNISLIDETLLVGMGDCVRTLDMYYIAVRCFVNLLISRTVILSYSEIYTYCGILIHLSLYAITSYTPVCMPNSLIQEWKIPSLRRQELPQTGIPKMPDLDNLENREAKEATQGVEMPGFGLVCNTEIITEMEA